MQVCSQWQIQVCVLCVAVHWPPQIRVLRIKMHGLYLVCLMQGAKSAKQIPEIIVIFCFESLVNCQQVDYRQRCT